MAPRGTPSKEQKKKPQASSSNKHVMNDKGEIINWDGSSQDARELKLYVEHGCCDGLLPVPVKEKYPQFQKYAHNTFAGARLRYRESYNKQVDGRGKETCKLNETQQEEVEIFSAIL